MSKTFALIGASVGVALAYYATEWLHTTVRNLENPPPAHIGFEVYATALAFTVALSGGSTLTAAA